MTSSRPTRFIALLLGTLCTPGVLACGDSSGTTTGGDGGSGGAGSTSASGGGGGGAATAPTAPTGLMVEPLGAGLHVTWTDASDNEDNFVLERHDGSGTFAEVVTLPFDSNQYHDEGGLTSGTTYTYRVGAMNAVDMSYSAEVSAAAP